MTAPALASLLPGTCLMDYITTSCDYSTQHNIHQTCQGRQKVGFKNMSLTTRRLLNRRTIELQVWVRRARYAYRLPESASDISVQVYVVYTGHVSTFAEPGC